MRTPDPSNPGRCTCGGRLPTAGEGAGPACACFDPLRAWYRFRANTALIASPDCVKCILLSENGACEMAGMSVSFDEDDDGPITPEWCPRRRPADWPAGQ